MAPTGLLVLVLVLWVTAGGGKPSRAPLVPHRPFAVVWNAPTEPCRLRFGVDLDLSVFDIVANLNETLSGPSVTIFYHGHLGHYPYYSDSGFPVNGGLPQNQSIAKHLSKARGDIDKLIPHKDFRGLAVIDWEDWRPQWVRNWGAKDVYRNKSKEQIRRRHPDWPESKVEKEAKEVFEKAGRDFMNLTLALAEARRPGGLWGFYLFPDCYNYGYKQHPRRYTGECPNVEHVRNDHLMWLWKESTALFPSVYLDYELRSSANAVKFVHYRVKEAMRIAAIARPDVTLPVFVYSRPFYAYTFAVLSEVNGFASERLGFPARFPFLTGVFLRLGWSERPGAHHRRERRPRSVRRRPLGFVRVRTIAEELPDGEEVHRRAAGPLRGQRDVGRQAVQQSAVPQERPLRAQEPRLQRLPAPRPAVLQRPPPGGAAVAAAVRPPLPRQGPLPPRPAGRPGHEAQVLLPVLPRLDRRPLRGAADGDGAPRWRRRRPDPAVASLLLPVRRRAVGGVAACQASLCVKLRTESPEFSQGKLQKVEMTSYYNKCQT
ncbi:hyaluronidase-like isoform X1 [Festucalex cinctus]